ncbi:MAG: hypothetical protein ACJ74Z_15285 [Bryobacteraceae bacterium]
MRVILKIFPRLLVLSVTFLLNASAEDRCNLARPVSAFVTARQSRLASMRDFARQNRISFGIESTSDLNEQVSISTAPGSVVSVLSAILGTGSEPIFRCLDGVIVVRDRRAAKAPNWLDTTVPDFQSNRSPLGLANTALSMRVEAVLHPQERGFAGDIPGDLGEQVGPFHVAHATVRTLLCQLVASSPGRVWISGNVNPLTGTTWSNRLWTLVPYERP